MTDELLYYYSLIKKCVPNSPIIDVLEKVYEEKGNLYTVMVEVNDGHKTIMWYDKNTFVYVVCDAQVRIKDENTVILKFNSRSIAIYVNSFCVIYIHSDLYNYIMNNKPKRIRKVIPPVMVGGARRPTHPPIVESDRRVCYANPNMGEVEEDG
jgi:hypothetical protein